ncbi:MAG: tetratricopeptide repeat-containing protein [Hymenobacter sp.]|nr:MAG: tetratricopeptide repeat-containing protein [Hymenobacter sp.]
MPSTRTVPDLASENLAKILVRQGKPDRAIAIYERLLVKHPEKAAYFTAQIDLLRPPA